MSKQTQIALDFGEEPSDPPLAPPAVADSGNKAGEPARPYMTAGGVGVRIKAYKQMPSPQTGDLFGGATPIDPVVAEAVATPMSVVEPPEPVVAQPEPVVPTREPETVMQAPEVMGRESEAAGQTPEHEIVPEVVVQERREPEVLVAAEVMPAAAETKPAVKEPVIKKPAAKASASRQPAVKQGPSKRGRKSLKQVAAEADLIEIPADEILFSKQYYTMGEVSAMFMVNQSLLRFWETEFDILQPKKNKKGDRYFRPIDIKNLHLIYHLLRQKKYTIEGAKEFLKNNKKADERFEVIQRLEQIKNFLLEWKAQL
jgi:DNA-binding transcriptional MerR regulator